MREPPRRPPRATRELHHRPEAVLRDNPTTYSPEIDVSKYGRGSECDESPVFRKGALHRGRASGAGPPRPPVTAITWSAVCSVRPLGPFRIKQTRSPRTCAFSISRPGHTVI